MSENLTMQDMVALGRFALLAFVSSTRPHLYCHVFVDLETEDAEDAILLKTPDRIGPAFRRLKRIFSDALRDVLLEIGYVADPR